MAALCLTVADAWADTVRIATFQTELSRDGPGLMLRDILRGDPQAKAIARIIAKTRPDILVLQGIDYDATAQGLRALGALIANEGDTYPFHFTRRPNSGMATGLDMNGNGRRGEPQDAQGFGLFAGHRGMAILSKWPIDEIATRDMSALLWRDVPAATLPHHPDGTPFPSQDAQAIQRLSSHGHWDVPILLPHGAPLHVLAFHATPPVFDGAEDRNGLRNAAEIRLWQHYLNGTFGMPPKERFVIAGVANIDPNRGTGRRDAIKALLADPRLQDPTSTSATGKDTTVDWPTLTPARIRASYILPSTDWHVIGSGVFLPSDDNTAASRHRLVWVDLEM